jgi:hypothetical protein
MRRATTTGRPTALGPSQKESAKQLGVDASMLARWERGEREPTGPFALRVQRFVADALTAYSHMLGGFAGSMGLSGMAWVRQGQPKDRQLFASTRWPIWPGVAVEHQFDSVNPYFCAAGIPE